MTTPEFPFHDFADPPRASRLVTKLHETFIASGSTHSVEEFSRAIAASLRQSPDPDLAVTNLLRYVEATTSKEALFNDLITHTVLMNVLVSMLSSSHYFADILVRNPELFRWLTASDSLLRPRDQTEFVEEVQRSLRLFQKPERKLDALKRLYRREILRIGARDILGEADLATATAELSLLADALIDASCTIAQQQLSERFPERPHSPYAVIGLGKLGGQELNYSSDIDIIFVYGDEGEVRDSSGKARTYHEYFNAFVEKMVVNLSQSSAEGHLYRVDTRLRPESGAGPLARSLTSYLLYYESRGELWERQMLIKARAVAGDKEFGAEFIRHLEPFVYPRTFLQNPREYIARIKSRIEAAIAGEENVKLRAGGIRDIEFVVQALQLIHGGKNKRIRSHTTLEAIRLLVDENLLHTDEGVALADAYVFFRTLEHRLQMMLNLQTAEMPKEEGALTILARKIGVDSSRGLRKKYDNHLATVRDIFERVLGTRSDRVELSLAGIVEGNVRPAIVAEVLGRFGFREKHKAARHFATLIAGSAMLETREFDIRVRNAFRDVVAVLFDEIAKTPAPDMTLHNLAMIVGAHAFPEQLYLQFKESSFRNLVLGVCGVSPRLAKGIAKYPLLLETIASDRRSLFGVRMETPLPAGSLAALKNQEEIRSGIRYVLGITDFDGLSGELTQLADVVLTSSLVQEQQSLRRKRIPLAIFALGKYGTREINFDSDLDVLFVSEAKSPAEQDTLESLARGVLKRMSAITEQGRLYDIDARLRPEGKSAPLVVDKNAYEEYLRRRASLWERQSLTRLRFVAGDEVLGQRVLKLVDEFVFASPLPAEWATTIVAMRKKTESRSRASNSTFLDIKLGPGGMVDIEFLAQMLQLKYAEAIPAARHVKTSECLQQLLPQLRRGNELEQLVSTYQLFRRVESFMRLALEEGGTVLADEAKLELIARMMSVSSGSELRRLLLAKMEFTRQTFLQVSNEII
ncbi:MAG: hypothetical protein HY961_00640 [Ignavibacteriae bacterium]|nr:hypothetical protein [Ignavibacteriota bacterium]